MRYAAFLLLFCCSFLSATAQTKVGGVVLDEEDEPVPFANVVFKNSTQGTVTNENGRFYMESLQTYDTLLVSFVGYARRELPLLSRVNTDMRVVLLPGEQLKEVVVYSGRMPKKNNPAVEILKKKIGRAHV